MLKKGSVEFHEGQYTFFGVFFAETSWEKGKYRELVRPYVETIAICVCLSVNEAFFLSFYKVFVAF